MLKHYDVFGKQSNGIWLKPPNKGYYAVQGHRGRYQSKARIEIPISDLYEGRSRNMLQNGIILIIMLIFKKIPNNLILNNSCERSIWRRYR